MRIVLLLAWAWACADAFGGEALFSERVWPLLDRACVKCHGPEKQKGDLRLDSRDAALKGGESGPALVPGKPGESLLLRLVRHAEPERDRMPPKEKLADADVVALEQWIAAGAPWVESPSKATVAMPSGEKIGDAWTDPRNPIVRIFGGQRLDLWSFQSIAQPSLPPVQNAPWVRNSIDQFVLAKLEASGARPAAEADRRTLARRLFFDLTGLPPLPEEVAAFEKDTAPDAYERLVERLLNSPRYGEHWARWWLDVIRYSDSNGFDWDEFRPQAWRFRDYVIRSLNADKPWDRFIREQLAGDELVAGVPRDAAEQDCLVATGFLRLGPWDNAAKLFGEEPKARQQLMADLVETTSSAFLGLTMACCRCHDHKYDPLSQADHYRLRAFFEPVKFRDDLPLDSVAEQEVIRQRNAPIDAQIAAKEAELKALLEPVKARLRTERVAKLSPDDRAILQTPESQHDAAAKERVKALEERVKVRDKEVIAALSDSEKARQRTIEVETATLKKQRTAFTTALVMTDNEGAPGQTHILAGGMLDQPREVVTPGFPSALDPNPAEIRKPVRERSTGRRSALAEWIVSKENPLTARVLVNRVWQAHFGEGIVATANDFGLAGARPNNPALLDWLAQEFMQPATKTDVENSASRLRPVSLSVPRPSSGETVPQPWSLKHLHRLIVSSSSYRQGAPPRRLQAEQLRDAMLAVAGRLQPSAGGPPVWPALPEEVLRANPAFLDDNAEKTKGWYPSPPERSDVRSVFLIQKRTVRVPLMEAFDLPENAVSCARRTVSTVAPQALTLLNNPFAIEMSRAFAQRVQRDAGEDLGAQVERAFALALQRPPGVDERAACVQFCRTRSLPEFCRALMNLNEFIYVD